jgi:hypothetical protein
MDVTHFFVLQVPLEPLVATLARPLRSRLEHAVDILVFNPPYVPTHDAEMDAAQHDTGLSGSWAGGADGMRVTDALLRQVDVGVFWRPMMRHPHSGHVIYRDCCHLEDDFTWSQ